MRRGVGLSIRPQFSRIDKTLHRRAHTRREPEDVEKLVNIAYG